MGSDYTFGFLMLGLGSDSGFEFLLSSRPIEVSITLRPLPLQLAILPLIIFLNLTYFLSLFLSILSSLPTSPTNNPPSFSHLPQGSIRVETWYV